MKYGKIIPAILFFIVLTRAVSWGQEQEALEWTLDINAPTISLPRVFKPNVDLSGRGFHREPTWPQTVAAEEVLDTWQKDIGLGGLYRMQYSLWEISQLAKNAQLQKKLLAHYESIMQRVTDSGGTIILDIFGTPAGMGKILDKKSLPQDLRAFKALVKNIIRNLSCDKKYNIWYEVWSAPDLDNFFLGRRQEYLNLYRAIAEAVKELEAETRMHIALGGPSVSWWFQNLEGNTALTPERSLIYELIKICYHYRLPLDFISWHGYSTMPGVEKELTVYKKTAVSLIRDWLSYFHFSKDIPLIVDEWNYDRNANLSAERQEKAFIAASYIPSRLKNMYEAGLDYQLYFCLEDFQHNKEGVVRNVGIFSFEPEHVAYKGAPKAVYNVFKMLANLGGQLFSSGPEDEFAGVIATKAEDSIVLLIYNYIDPDIAVNYLAKNIATFKSTQRKAVLNIINSDKLEKIMQGKIDIQSLRESASVKALLIKTRELNTRAKKFGLDKEAAERPFRLGIKNLKDNYSYARYALDSSCILNCEFKPVEQKEVSASDLYQEMLLLKPYSVHLIVLKKKLPETAAPITAPEIPAGVPEEKKE